jgi:hypothetical protein
VTSGAPPLRKERGGRVEDERRGEVTRELVGKKEEGA